MRICKLVWEQEKTLEEWNIGIILPLPQKGDLTYCNNSRGITLIDNGGKVFSIIMLTRVKEAVGERMREISQAFGRTTPARIRFSA